MTSWPITFAGPPIDDGDILARCTPALADLLRQANGFILHDGGLHVRGASLAPGWHSLREAWLGAAVVHRLYPGIHPDDIPFGQDCMGSQFLLREGTVWCLDGETGDLENLEMDLGSFLEASADPARCLGMKVLRAFWEQGESLVPGHLLSVYPPFCAKESADGVSLSAVPAEERRRFLADFAAQIRDVPDGTRIEIVVDE